MSVWSESGKARLGRLGANILDFACRGQGNKNHDTTTLYEDVA